MKNRNVRATLALFAITTALLLTAGCSDAEETAETTAVTEETETQTETTALSEEEEADETEAVTEAAAETSFTVLEEADYFESQNAVDAALQQELENGYSFEDPDIIINPYNNTPLTAVVIFSTEEETGGMITVKGKSEENDINGTFEAAYDHIVPVYGLYNGDTTEVVLTLDDGSTNTLEITTEGLDIAVGETTVEMIDDSSYDYDCLTFVCSMSGSLTAYDSAGDIRWYYSSTGVMGVHQLKNGHLMIPSNYLIAGTYYKSGLTEMDLNGKVYREYAVPGGEHHDFYELENGNLVIASDSPDLSTFEDYVVEIDRETGEVVWELDMKDLLDLTDGASSSMETDGTEEADWFHNNSLWCDEENDLILLSARHKDAIVAVNRSDNSLAWILGDPDGWETVDESYFFTPVGDDFEWQWAQHQVTMLDNGDIMMFDNGTAKVKRYDYENAVTGDDCYSRAVIYRIDTDAMTVEQVFEYGKERGVEWYADWVSGVESLDGTQDALWITAGAHLYSEEENRNDYHPGDMFDPSLTKISHIDQVTNGELTYELVISGETYPALSFRSFRMPLYTEGAGLDITQTGELLGSLGEKATADVDVSFDNPEELPEGWTFSLDATKLTLSGSFLTQTASADLPGAYLVLKSDDTVKAYSLTQTPSEGDDGTTVSTRGWCSPVGLEGSTYELYLLLDGITYRTGYEVIW